MIGKILSFTAFIILWAILFIGLVIVPKEKRKISSSTKPPKDKVPKQCKQSEERPKKELARADKKRKEEHKRKENGHKDTAHSTCHRADTEETIACTQECSKDKDGNYDGVDSSEFL